MPFLSNCCCAGPPPGPCSGVTFPRGLTYTRFGVTHGSVAQAQASFYFANEADASPEASSYALTYGPRPSAVPAELRLEYFNQPVGISPPYYITVPDQAWFSPGVPAHNFDSPTTVYFYGWWKGCVFHVMVIDAPYGNPAYGTPVTEGAGNNVKSYVIQSGGSSGTLSLGPSPTSFTVLTGAHGDDVPPDSQGGAGYPTAVRSGP